MAMQKFRMSGKAKEMVERDQTTGLVGELAGSEVKQNEFSDLRAIPVADIRVDPDQARQLGITLEMLRNPESVTDSSLSGRIDAILGLAETMGHIGQQTAIEVFQEGSHFNLVAGERRLWAARLLGLQTLNAKVLPEKPQRLRLKQYIENAQREGLSTRETLTALEDLLQESARIGEPVNSFSDLKRQTGMPNSTASRWWSVLSGPKDVRVAISQGSIRTLRAADMLSKISDELERQRLTDRMSEAEKKGELMAVLGEVSARRRKAPPARQLKAPRSIIRINFATANIDVGRRILSRLVGRPLSEFEIESPKALMQGISDALKALEGG